MQGSGEVLIQDSRGTRVRRGQWRVQVVRVMAGFIAAYAPVQVLTGLRPPLSFAHFGPPAVVMLAALWAALGPRLSARARAFILCAPMLATGIMGIYYIGASTGTVLVFTQITVVLGLVAGGTAGVLTLLVTGVCFALFGALGRSHLDELSWVRAALTYTVSTGVLLFAVTMAVRRVEQALADTQEALAQAQRLRHEREEARARQLASEERLHLTLQAASVATWSLVAGSRRFIWDEAQRGAPLDLILASPPATLAEMLQRIPGDDRARVSEKFEDVLEGRSFELHVEHALAVPGAPVIWVEARGRLVSIDAVSVLVGTVVDVTARRRQEERRAEAQAKLLVLSTSETVSRGELEASVRGITEVGQSILDVARCGLWLHSDDGRTLDGVDLFRRGRGHGRGPQLVAGAYPAYFAALTRQRTVAADNARTDERTRELLPYLEEHDITSLLDSPVHVGGRLVGVLCHEHVGLPPRRWTVDEELAAGSLADFVSRVVEASERARAERRLQLAYRQLGQVTRRMEVVREEERRTIARELHDELGGTLTAVKLHLALAAREEDDRPRLAETAAIVDRALRTTRELSQAMRPPLLDEVGLIPALQAFLDEQARCSDVTFALDAAVPARPTAEIETAAFRVVQETVTNVLRHACARHVKVAVAAGDDLTIAVRDDGRGFEVESTMERVAAGGHLGLVGMRERARALGGRFSVLSTPGGGTEVRVELPLASGGAPS